LSALRTTGCDFAQGYLFGMPRPVGDIRRLISGTAEAEPVRFRPIMPAAQHPLWIAGETPRPIMGTILIATRSLGTSLTIAGIQSVVSVG